MSDRFLRSLPALASLTVGLASFALSYVALRDVAVELDAVPAHLGWLVPVVIDGGVIGASAVLWSHARSGERTPWLAVVIVMVLVSMSVVVNTAHAGPALLAKVIAALPPLVLLGTLELVAAEHRRASRARDRAQTDPAPAPELAAAPAPAPAPAAQAAAAAAPALAAADGGPDHTPRRAGASAAVPAAVPAAGPADTPARHARRDITAATPTPTPAPAPASSAPTAAAASVDPAAATRGTSPATPAPAPAPTGRTRTRVVAAAPDIAPDHDRPASEVIEELYLAHVADGGDPDDPALAKTWADQTGVSVRHARRTIARLRDTRPALAAA